MRTRAIYYLSFLVLLILEFVATASDVQEDSKLDSSKKKDAEKTKEIDAKENGEAGDIKEGKKSKSNANSKKGKGTKNEEEGKEGKEKGNEKKESEEDPLDKLPDIFGSEDEVKEDAEFAKRITPEFHSLRNLVYHSPEFKDTTTPFQVASISLKQIIFDLLFFRRPEFELADIPQRTYYNIPLPPKLYSSPVTLHQYIWKNTKFLSFLHNIWSFYLMPSLVATFLYAIGIQVEPIIFRHSLRSVVQRFALMLACVLGMAIFNGVFSYIIALIFFVANYFMWGLSYLPLRPFISSIALFFQIRIYANDSIFTGRIFFGLFDYVVLETIQSLFVYERLSPSWLYPFEWFMGHVFLELFAYIPFTANFNVILGRLYVYRAVVNIMLNLAALRGYEFIVFPYVETYDKDHDLEGLLNPSGSTWIMNKTRQFFYYCIRHYSHDFKKATAPYTLSMSFAFAQVDSTSQIAKDGHPRWKRNLRFAFLRVIQLGLWVNLIMSNVGYLFAVSGNQGLESLFSPYYGKSFDFTLCFKNWFNRYMISYDDLKSPDTPAAPVAAADKSSIPPDAALLQGKNLEHTKLHRFEISNMALGQDFDWIIDEKVIRCADPSKLQFVENDDTDANAEIMREKLTQNVTGDSSKEVNTDTNAVRNPLYSSKGNFSESSSWLANHLSTGTCD